ncbi:hypothetical protein U713_17695 [Rhodobacter capsulatus YW2]|nr:hypothetical protein U713_17695 [Rhodobacter capsulatus YW2]
MANDLDRTMLAEWSGRAAQLLAPVIDAMMTELRRSDLLQWMVRGDRGASGAA